MTFLQCLLSSERNTYNNTRCLITGGIIRRRKKNQAKNVYSRSWKIGAIYLENSGFHMIRYWMLEKEKWNLKLQGLHSKEEKAES